jgi:hypothetical protein
MSRGPAKVSVRVDANNSDEAAEEALRTYEGMILNVASIERRFDARIAATEEETIPDAAPSKRTTRREPTFTDPDFDPDLTG